VVIGHGAASLLPNFLLSQYHHFQRDALTVFVFLVFFVAKSELAPWRFTAPR
jgi:hypothetical protein